MPLVVAIHCHFGRFVTTHVAVVKDHFEPVIAYVNCGLGSFCSNDVVQYNASTIDCHMQ